MKNLNHRHWRWLPVLCLIGLFPFGCSDTQPPTDSLADTDVTASLPDLAPSPGQLFHVDYVPEQARQRIRIEEVKERLTPHSVSAPGNVALDLAHVAKVSSRIPGQVDKVMVQLGDRVTKDQPLAAVESMRLDELVQEYLVAKSKLDVASSNFKRTKQLLAENIISQRRFLEDRGQQIETQAVYQHVREKLLNMGLSQQELQQLEHGSHLEGHKYLLRAPLSGTVVSQQIVLGQGVAAGDEFFEIVDTSRVWVFANLPIEQARRFQEGDEGQVLPRGGEPITARLTYIAPVADATTRTIRVRFDVENPKGRLKPNEYVEVRLIDQQHPALSIPLSALTMLDGVRGVFVQRDNGYDFVFVETGREGGGLVEITRGLKLGEHVVTEGVFDLKNAIMKTSIQGE
ncbi:efflux RND transporter periplasmic adaptor subunit [Nitrospira sp. T9]|uniref:efflux RND transporter periplasmic adaptor subunit n=1 Tax=Nitrospira sp. TaxID=70125 RepID=UPI003FC41DB0